MAQGLIGSPCAFFGIAGSKDHHAVDVEEELRVPNQLTKLQKYSAPALEKGLDILELLSLSATEMSLSQIAAGVGRSKNEIFRMMIVLEERQFISRTAGDQYSLTDRLSVLGSSRSKHNRLAEVAMPVLSGLSEKTSFSCHLSVLQDDVVLVVAQAEAAKGYSISVQVGHRCPVAESSAGVCMLAVSRQGGPSTRSGSEDDDTARALTANPQSDAGLTDMPNPELPGITELSAPIIGTTGDDAVAAITIPFMTAMIADNHKIAMRADLLDAARLIRQRIAILLPQF
ncbi:MAG: DNA-binding IclR family transcriptional regulator [Pseudorhodobacter sp.]|jgi:DNA-binding IclR family transcriptional regulator